MFRYTSAKWSRTSKKALPHEEGIKAVVLVRGEVAGNGFPRPFPKFSREEASLQVPSSSVDYSEPLNLEVAIFMVLDVGKWANMFLVEHSVSKNCLDHGTFGMQRVVWQMQSTDSLGVFSWWCCYFINVPMVNLGSTGKAFCKEL